MVVPEGRKKPGLNRVNAYPGLKVDREVGQVFCFSSLKHSRLLRIVRDNPTAGEVKLLSEINLQKCKLSSYKSESKLTLIPGTFNPALNNRALDTGYDR